ncbi:PREDICTED: uncharacterized protein LOC104727405 [Camelina sativa]|uniref:Uncharacterized protein LOC104727405 n=1 Tax=Camelina sativa TaxID=90675 RepID=A0ABM1QWT5_CAMSA|nr:PREDICTED: uncharacterized protein LOC104727405 [Camelina sativa]XP_019091223.1 PREDICTED: uncharacterized protein LOC104727405 [Camelina sativa]
MNEKYEADAFIESCVRKIDRAMEATADKYADFQCVYDELKLCLRKCFTISEIQSHMETSFGLPGNDTEELIIRAIRPFHTAYLLFAEDASRQRQEVPEVEENTGGNEGGEIYVEEPEAVIAGGMDEHHVVTDAESASQSSGIREGQVEVNAGGMDEHQVVTDSSGIGESQEILNPNPVLSRNQRKTQRKNQRKQEKKRETANVGRTEPTNETTSVAKNEPTNETTNVGTNESTNEPTNVGGELTNVGILSSLKEVVESVEILKSEMKGIKKDLSVLNSLPMELKEILHKHNEVLKIIPDLRTKPEL